MTIVTKASSLSYESIRDYAELVGEHHAIYEQSGTADIMRLVADLGGRVEYADTQESLHVSEPGKFTIFLPQSTSARRDRFTLAHELGHYFLHYLHPNTSSEMSYGRGSRNLAETQANVFAASLLMPEQQFRHAFRELEGDAWRLANRFGVSPAAVTVRCQVLKLGSTA
jgi:Zn-dependent peptidase ImmA (M78 family)